MKKKIGFICGISSRQTKRNRILIFKALDSEKNRVEVAFESTAPLCPGLLIELGGINFMVKKIISNQIAELQKMKPFSEKIKEWLKSNDLLQKEGAEHLKIPERTLRRWLAGKYPHKDRQLIIEERMEIPIFK